MSKPQSQTIKDTIMIHLDEGITDKQEIYTKVATALKVPRPTVRRVAGDLRREIEEKIQSMEAQRQHIEGQLRVSTKPAGTS